MALTLKPGTLVVASAYPDPPFDLIENGSASGFDIELMRAISSQLGVALESAGGEDGCVRAHGSALPRGQEQLGAAHLAVLDQ